jgi:hypothetical protein
VSYIISRNKTSVCVGNDANGTTNLEGCDIGITGGIDV